MRCGGQCRWCGAELPPQSGSGPRFKYCQDPERRRSACALAAYNQARRRRKLADPEYRARCNAQNRAWARANREKQAKWQRAWYRRNRVKVLAAQKSRRRMLRMMRGEIAPGTGR